MDENTMNVSIWQSQVSSMSQDMFTLSGAPSATSHLFIYIYPIIFYLDSPLS